MLRYLHRLQTKDLSLATAMIPLGSCTMKLNATAEMVPVSPGPSLARFIPLHRLSKTQGYRQLFADWKLGWQKLLDLTAFRYSPTPGPRANMPGCWSFGNIINSGATTTATGLSDSPIGPWYQSGQRGHGGHESGARKSVTKTAISMWPTCRPRPKSTERLAALMVTYPSTHGVFEAAIHDHLRHRPSIMVARCIWMGPT
jgi:glycine dehydrogenase